MHEGIELYPKGSEGIFPRYGKRYHLVGKPVLIRNANGSGTVRVKFTVYPSEEVQQFVFEVEAGALRMMREAFTLEGK